ncbi:hypothetical protein B0H12DRAFT_583919 [Mycena haematopus]|nr:hypothetical protein B0H12DRAFT_583919 [Mycena haematopus]
MTVRSDRFFFLCLFFVGRVRTNAAKKIRYVTFTVSSPAGTSATPRPSGTTTTYGISSPRALKWTGGGMYCKQRNEINVRTGFTQVEQKLDLVGGGTFGTRPGRRMSKRARRSHSAPQLIYKKLKQHSQRRRGISGSGILRARVLWTTASVFAPCLQQFFFLGKKTAKQIARPTYYFRALQLPSCRPVQQSPTIDQKVSAYDNESMGNAGLWTWQTEVI